MSEHAFNDLCEVEVYGNFFYYHQGQVIIIKVIIWDFQRRSKRPIVFILLGLFDSVEIFLSWFIHGPLMVLRISIPVDVISGLEKLKSRF